MVPQGLTLATCSQPGLNPRPASRRLSVYVRRPDKTATSTTTPKGKYTESLTFSTPNCIYADYGKLGKPSLQPLAHPEELRQVNCLTIRLPEIQDYCGAPSRLNFK